MSFGTLRPYVVEADVEGSCVSTIHATSSVSSTDSTGAVTLATTVSVMVSVPPLTFAVSPSTSCRVGLARGGERDGADRGNRRDAGECLEVVPVVERDDFQEIDLAGVSIQELEGQKRVHVRSN